MKTVEIVGLNYFGEWDKCRTACRGIIIKDGRMLLSYETNTDTWMVPGGGLEPGEEEQECCIREVAEETGIRIVPSECVLEIDEYYEDWKYVNRYFFGKIIGQCKQKLTEREMAVGLVPRWLPVDEITDIFSQHNVYSETDEMRRGMYLREYTAIKEVLRNQEDHMDRPDLELHRDSKSFRDYYYLKEELTDFCQRHHLPISGNKAELTERIAHYLDSGEVRQTEIKRTVTRRGMPAEITRSGIIEEGVFCSQAHRAFFRKEIGNSFSFNVRFQEWLKANAGKTYDDAITAYREILNEKKNGRSSIGKQFEYNTYIRDFFSDNPGKGLADAIKCWKSKKGMKGHNRYERSDLKALDQ